MRCQPSVEYRVTQCVLRVHAHDRISFSIGFSLFAGTSHVSAGKVTMNARLIILLFTESTTDSTTMRTLISENG